MALPTIANDNTLFNTDDFLSPKVYQDGVTAIVDRLKREGDLTRNSGTNSIKSLKEVSFNLLSGTESQLDYMKKLLDNFGGLENSIKDSTDATLDYFRKKDITDEERYRELQREKNKDDGGNKDDDSKSKKEDSFSITSLLGAMVVPGVLALVADVTGWVDDLVIAIGKVVKLAQSIFAPLQKGLTLINTFFTNTFMKPIQGFIKTVKPVFSLFGKLKLFLDPILKIVPSILGGLGKIFPMFTIITGIIDFAKGFTDKFSAADTMGEGILEGLYGGITEVISGIIMRPFDLLKDFAGWVATELGFPKVEEYLDTFSFDDMFRKAVSWFYNTETNQFFNGYFDNLPFPDALLATITDAWNALIMKPIGVLNDFFIWTGEQLGFDFEALLSEPIKKFWDSITNIFSGDFSAENLTGGVTALTDIVYAPVNLAIDWIRNLFGWKSPEEEPFKLNTFLTDTINLAINAIKDIFKWGDPEEPFKLSNFIQETINKAIDWVKGIFGFGKSDDGGILPKIEMPNPLTSLSEGLRKSDLTLVGIDFGAKIADVIDSITGTDDIEPREKGGPIQEDKPYLVGEAGPELIIPNSSGKVIPAPQTGAILDAGSRMMADNARVSVSPVIAPQSNDNRTIVSNKSVTYQGHMTTRNSDPTIRALNSSLAYA